eukprot:901164_1
MAREIRALSHRLAPLAARLLRRVGVNARTMRYMTRAQLESALEAGKRTIGGDVSGSNVSGDAVNEDLRGANQTFSSDKSSDISSSADLSVSSNGISSSQQSIDTFPIAANGSVSTNLAESPVSSELSNTAEISSAKESPEVENVADITESEWTEMVDELMDMIVRSHVQHSKIRRYHVPWRPGQSNHTRRESTSTNPRASHEQWTDASGQSEADLQDGEASPGVPQIPYWVVPDNEQPQQLPSELPCRLKRRPKAKRKRSDAES